MLKYRIESLLRSKPGDGKIAPFPGKYPTRIAYRVYHYDAPGGYEDYIGKPNQIAVRRFFRLIGDRGAWYFTACEFDRKSIFVSYAGNAPWQIARDEFPIWGRNSVVYDVYHPYETYHRMFVDFHNKFQVYRVDKNYSFYAPREISFTPDLIAALKLAAASYGYVDERAATIERAVPKSLSDYGRYSVTQYRRPPRIR